MGEILKFPYTKIGEKFFPIIPLYCKQKEKEFRLEALIDAGSTTSIFKFEVFEILGLKVENCKRIPLKGIGGSITAYSHEISLIIGDKTIKTEVAFSKELEMKINIIGREGVFENFVVCYNDKEKNVSLAAI